MFAKSFVAAALLATTSICVAVNTTTQYGQTATAPAAKPATIVQTAKDAGQFNTLCELVTAAGLVDTLNSAGPFTVFAPTDAAFAKLPPETVAALKKDPKALAAILTYHVVPGKKDAAEVVKMKEIMTVQGQPIMITIVDGKVMLNKSATVVKTDVGASNGVIHVIDTVIMPPAKKSDSAMPAGMPGMGAGSKN
ncbi:hypothetical protein LBMAG50_02570 [Phycisphaerae bacterium]|nr:hypothetical protein LBMAG50_02570 [Phycisphaerae bacterium]